MDAKTDRIDSEVRRRLDRLDDELGRVATGETDIRERIARRRRLARKPRITARVVGTTAIRATRTS